MARRESRNIQKKNIKKIIALLVIILVLIISIVIFVISRNKLDTSKTRLIINNNNVTERLKQEVLIENNIIYLSINDIKNFFDEYLYFEKEINKIVTTYGSKIAEIGFEEKSININGAKKEIFATAIEKNEITYLPISEMRDVYNIEIKYNNEDNVITMDSLNKELIKADMLKNSSVKSQPKFLSRKLDKIKRGEGVVIITETENGWAKVRTEAGIMGYVKKDKLTNIITLRENLVQKERTEKVSLVWDYFSQYAKAPDRTSENIEGIKIVSPAFFYITEKGEFKENIGNAGKEYIEWAHSKNYEVWPMVSNAEAGIEMTSKILNSYEARRNLVEKIVAMCVKYELDGINIDFENMYQEDKDLFSRFIIELTPRMKDIGVITSVDVTAPDGSETWSLCYNRNVIGDVADYIIFMAYDQYGISSKKPGTTAGYNWVETSIKKFVGVQEDIDSNKVILGIPFYTRIWTITSNGEASSKVINMKEIESIIPDNVQKVWDEELKQYIIEYTSGNTTKKIWIEDLDSIKQKLSLVSQYELGGVACWEKDRETEEVWSLIKENLK